MYLHPHARKCSIVPQKINSCRCLLQPRSPQPMTARAQTWRGPERIEKEKEQQGNDARHRQKFDQKTNKLERKKCLPYDSTQAPPLRYHHYHHHHLCPPPPICPLYLSIHTPSARTHTTTPQNSTQNSPRKTRHAKQTRSVIDTWLDVPKHAYKHIIISTDLLRGERVDPFCHHRTQRG